MPPDKKAIGARLRELREEPRDQHGRPHRSREKWAMTLRAAAGPTAGDLPGVASLAKMIQQWERGDHVPGPMYRPLYAKVTGMTEEELFGGLPPAKPFVGTDEDRRHLLACLGLLGVETASRTEPLEPIRQALMKALPGGARERLVQDWEEIAYEHGHAFLTTPPDQLLPDLAADVVTLLAALQSARGSNMRALCGPAGKLAALTAMTVSTLGQRRHARDWWKTARHASDASKGRDLRMWVRGYEAMNALYSGRPLSMVLRLSQDAIQIGGNHVGAAALEAMATRAQALSMMEGRADEAATAMRDLVDRWEHLPASEPDDRLATGAWPETALHHTAAYVYTYTGEAALAEQAQTAALARYPTSMRRQRAQIELLRATGMVRAGDVAGGVEHAGRTLEGLATVQRTATVQRGACLVLDAVPDADLTRSAVQDYRDAFALPSAGEE
ncbi:hypothetical protein [Actinomadura sp. NEAU-AAG7]|uniref:hypothetical protein n=1 Tax=Actinomadura sp. NEAU-AAG7 TaxID=2839640 RepID=UPI001BE44D78|nr:hypothetical protein [Actinomadura sp. NEAU-AAG7]MBT2207032.1 hypothetical protein [Actinomadura sp. NEAU-AAG7]